MRYALVFFVVIALDFCWAKYVTHISDGTPHRAAFWSTAIMLGSAFSTISYVADRWALIPALAGAYVGTYFAVKYRAKK